MTHAKEALRRLKDPNVWTRVTFTASCTIKDAPGMVREIRFASNDNGMICIDLRDGDRLVWRSAVGAFMDVTFQDGDILCSTDIRVVIGGNGIGEIFFA